MVEESSTMSKLSTMSRKNSGALSSTDYQVAQLTTDGAVDPETLIGVIEELAGQIDQLEETVDQQEDTIERMERLVWSDDSHQRVTDHLSDLEDTVEAQATVIENKDERLDRLEDITEGQRTIIENQEEIIDGKEAIIASEGIDGDNGVGKAPTGDDSTLDHRLTNLETELAETTALVDALRNKTTTLDEEFTSYRETNEKDKADIRQFAKEAVHEAAEQAPADQEHAEDEHPPEPRLQTPLERVIENPRKSGITPTRSVQRAMSIAAHFPTWADSARAGRVIKDNLKMLLSTATGESLAWKQVYRACEKLEELSNGRIEFKKHDRLGKILVGDEDFLTRVVRRKTGG